MGIRARIILWILPVVIAVTFLVAYIPVELGKRTVGKSLASLPQLVSDITEMKKDVEKTQEIVLQQTMSIMERLAESEAANVRSWIDRKFSLVRRMAKDEAIEAAFTVFQKMYVTFALSNYSGVEGYTNVFLINPEGKAYDAKGNEYEIDPKLIKPVLENTSVEMIVVPFDMNGEPQMLFVKGYASQLSGMIKGAVAATVPQKEFVDLIRKIKVGKTGYAYVANSEGLAIAHPDDKVVNKVNFLKDEELKKLGEAMLSGKTGHVFYRFRGVNKFAVYSPIGYGLYLGIGMAIDEILEGVKGVEGLLKTSEEMISTANEIREGFVEAVKKAMIIGIIVGLVGVGVLSLIIYLAAGSISKPLRMLAEVSDKLDQGDLTVEVPQFKGDPRKDEISNLAKSFAKLKETLRETIGEINEMGEKVENVSKSLSEMVEDNMVKTEEAMSVVDNVGRMINNVTESAQNANSGMEEINAGAQSLADYANELREIAMDMKASSDETGKTMESLSESMNSVKETMENTVRSMKRLLELSDRINQIVDTISGIAEQTNLLALNAAIEAARAGEAGKGFAVVADEIRKLAEESQKSAEEIAAMLSEIRNQAHKISEDGATLSERIDKSVEMAGSSIETLRNLLEKIERVSSMTDDLANTSQEQSEAANEVSQAIDTIARELVEVDEEAKRIVDFLKETTDTVMEVNKEAENLKEYVDSLTRYLKKFKV